MLFCSLNTVSLDTFLLKRPITKPAQLAQVALFKEICLSPKPGLVDRINNGSHIDMNFNTFIESIKAISPWLDEFYLHGKKYYLHDYPLFLSQLRTIGLACENDMFVATNAINTHKGAIFGFGLLLSIIGRLEANNVDFDYQIICDEVAKMCQGLVKQELGNQNNRQTAGEKLYQTYQLTGARGEAESGYQTVTAISLPIFTELQSQGYDEETVLLQVMLHLLANNMDTNLVSRGGFNGLHLVQNYARQLLNQGGMLSANGMDNLHAFDKLLIAKRLSPGGSADLIAITWFLAQYTKK